MAAQPLAALLVTAAFAALALALGLVSRGGALGGLLVGTVVYWCLGPQGFAVLALFVVGGSALTRLGYGRKRRAGTAEAGGGRRGAKNALANCGVAVACAVACAIACAFASATVAGSEALYPRFAAAFAAAFVASLGAAFADTAESEVGSLFGGAPRLISTLKRVTPGTDGAVSAPGTLAGAGAAVLTAVLGLALGLVPGPGSAALVALAAFAGTVADSLVGALAPRAGNEATNVVCTLVAAGLAFSAGLLLA